MYVRKTKGFETGKREKEFGRKRECRNILFVKTNLICLYLYLGYFECIIYSIFYLIKKNFILLFH